MNKKIVCVTCLRDFYKLQRQIESFRLYLPSNYEILYIIEGDASDKFLELWNLYSDNHGALSNKITIKTSNDFIPPDTPNYYEKDISKYSITGWHRQQLLKLIAVANQSDEICIVIDSKDFLINPLPEDIGGIHLWISRNKIDNTYSKTCLPLYEKKLNLYLDTKGGVTTPVPMIPTVIRNGMNKFKNFIQWWIAMSLFIGWMSEFQLYHIWYVDQKQPLVDYKHTKVAIWRKEWSNYFTNSVELIDFLNSEKNKDVYWLSLANNVSIEWDDDLKKGFLSWLKNKGLTGRWNYIDMEFLEKNEY